MLLIEQTIRLTALTSNTLKEAVRNKVFDHLLIQMVKVKAIALNTLKEAIRNKVFYNQLIFALLVIAASVLIGDLSLGVTQKIVKDIGLAAILIFGLLTAILIGTSLISKEVEKRTLYTILAKPVRRYEFLLGKYVGLCLTLLVNVAVMSAFLSLIITWKHGVVNLALLKAILLIYCELILVTAIALLFSTLSSQALSAVFTIGLYIIGNLTADLKEIGVNAEDQFSRWLIDFCYYILPNFSNFNIRAEVVHGVQISNAHILSVVLYTILYVAVFVFLSMILFRRKELL